MVILIGTSKWAVFITIIQGNYTNGIFKQVLGRPIPSVNFKTERAILKRLTILRQQAIVIRSYSVFNKIVVDLIGNRFSTALSTCKRNCLTKVPTKIKAVTSCCSWNEPTLFPRKHGWTRDEGIFNFHQQETCLRAWPDQAGKKKKLQISKWRVFAIFTIWVSSGFGEVRDQQFKIITARSTWEFCQLWRNVRYSSRKFGKAADFPVRTDWFQSTLTLWFSVFSSWKSVPSSASSCVMTKY